MTSHPPASTTSASQDGRADGATRASITADSHRHDGGHRIPHDHLDCRSSVTRIEFHSRGPGAPSTVGVEWTASPESTDRRRQYTGRITTGVARPYLLSLYTIGLQGRRWRVRLKLKSGKNVKLVDPAGNEWPLVIDQVVKLNATGMRRLPPIEGETSSAHAAIRPPRAAGIWFIKFDGEAGKESLVVEVVSRRRQHRADYHEVRPKTDHDEAPPPPEPGGEEGDGDGDGDDGEEDDGGE